MTTMSQILARLERLEKQLNLDRKVGNWVRATPGGPIIWDPWDMDAPPDTDPTPRLLAEMDRIRERLMAQPDYKPPMPDQLERGRRTLDGAARLQTADARPARARAPRVRRSP
jgi:hypothetical protein